MMDDDAPSHPWLVGLAEAEESDELTYAEAIAYLLRPTPRGLPAPVYEQARRWLVTYIDLYTGGHVFAPGREFEWPCFPATAAAAHDALAPLVAKLVEISVLLQATDRSPGVVIPFRTRRNPPTP